MTHFNVWPELCNTIFLSVSEDREEAVDDGADALDAVDTLKGGAQHSDLSGALESLDSQILTPYLLSANLRWQTAVAGGADAVAGVVGADDEMASEATASAGQVPPVSTEETAPYAPTEGGQ